MRRALIVLALVAACKDPSPPSGFGVDLTITAPASLVAAAASAKLRSSGAEIYEVTLPLTDFQSGVARLRYVPLVKSGVLDLTVALLDAGGATIGACDSGPVTLNAGGSTLASCTIVGGGGDGGMPHICTPACGPGMFCDASNTCKPLRTLGQSCAAQSECTAGLTCLDGVCCGTAVCPVCMNCGSSGACDVKVGSAAGTEDTTVNACMGMQACDANNACKKKLGQACTSGMDCVSGNCVDSVCCGSAMCPQCRNCGPTGACDQVVMNADDVSDTICNADNSCNAAGMCIARWSQQTIINNKNLGSFSFVTGLGNVVYMASSSGCSTDYLIGYNTTNNAITTEGTTNSPVQACGFVSEMIGVNGKLHYIANAAGSYVPGASPPAGWVNYPTYPNTRGEAAITNVGNVIYFIGGRLGSNVNTADTQTYDTVTQMWSSTTMLPVTGSNLCGGTIGTKVYVIAGSNGQNMYQLDTSTNSWMSLPNLPMSIRCFRQYMPTWRGRLVLPNFDHADIWDPTNGWQAPLPVPTGGMHWQFAVAGTSGDLYALGDFGANLVIYKYTFN